MEKVEIYYPKPAAHSSDASHSPGKDSLLIKVNKIKFLNEKRYFSICFK